MLRFSAFAFLVFAAFAWSLPFLDRAGTAALGFAFLALAVGRRQGEPRPSTLDSVRELLGPSTPTIEPVMLDPELVRAAFRKEAIPAAEQGTPEHDELLAAYLADEK